MPYEWHSEKIIFQEWKDDLSPLSGSPQVKKKWNGLAIYWFLDITCSVEKSNKETKISQIDISLPLQFLRSQQYVSSNEIFIVALLRIFCETFFLGNRVWENKILYSYVSRFRQIYE